MILRQFEREAARKRDELAERGIQDKQLKNVDKDKHLLLVGLFKRWLRKVFLSPFHLLTTHEINLFRPLLM